LRHNNFFDRIYANDFHATDATDFSCFQFLADADRTN